MIMTKFKERRDQFGVDIHASREAPKIANPLYIGGPKFGSRHAFVAMPETFAKFAWNPEDVGIFAFMSTVTDTWNP
jgi:hypothetical protein